MEAMVRQSAATQLIQGSIKGLSVISCIYSPEKRASSQSQVHYSSCCDLVLILVKLILISYIKF